METPIRTTLDIPADTWRELKIHAATQRTSLRAILLEAVSLWLATARKKEPKR
jgi:hypothetical protein